MASLSSTGRFSRRFTLLLLFLSLLFLHSTAHAVDTLSDPPTGSCGLPIPGGQRPGTHQEATINKRSYLIFLPSNYEDPHSELSRPLILSFHGGGRTPIQQLDLDNFTSPDFNKDAVVVYPKGENVSTAALIESISLGSLICPFLDLPHVPEAPEQCRVHATYCLLFSLHLTIPFFLSFFLSTAIFLTPPEILARRPRRLGR